MYQILEIAPGIVFIASYFFVFDQDIYWATACFMIALAVQFIICFLFKLKISKLMWVVLVVGMTAGTITIVFQMPIIIKWRPTAISWAMSAAFLTTHFFGRKNILKWLLEDYVQLSDRLWNYQTLVLGIVFLLSGTTNIVVAYSFSEPTWMFYKFISWFVWPLLSGALLGIVFWVEHRRTGGAIFEQDSNDAITQKLTSGNRHRKSIELYRSTSLRQHVAERLPAQLIFYVRTLREYELGNAQSRDYNRMSLK